MFPSLSNVTVRYGQAIISWCFDLTEPQLTSEVVAVMIVAETEGKYSLTVASRLLPRESSLNLLSRSMLRDLPAFLDRQVLKMRTARQLSIEDIIDQLQDELNGSLSITTINSPRTTEVGTLDLQLRLAGLARESLREAVGAARPMSGVMTLWRLIE